MKQPKSKVITDDILDGNTAEAKPAVVMDLGKKLGGLPTTGQLALIAATLARKTNAKPKVLADAALELWFAARDSIESAERFWLFSDKYWDVEDELPRTRDSFLRYMMPLPSHRPEVLATTARKYLTEVLRDKNKKQPTSEEVADAYAKWNPCETLAQANAEAVRFGDWHVRYINELRRAAGLSSAAVKKLKKKL